MCGFCQGKNKAQQELGFKEQAVLTSHLLKDKGHPQVHVAMSTYVPEILVINTQKTCTLPFHFLSRNYAPKPLQSCHSKERKQAAALSCSHRHHEQSLVS